MAIDGQSHQLLWEMRLNHTYDTYNMLALDYFVGEDEAPVFFTSFGKGLWLYGAILCNFIPSKI